jgi:hypothetical protein
VAIVAAGAAAIVGIGYVAPQAIKLFTELPAEVQTGAEIGGAIGLIAGLPTGLGAVFTAIAGGIIGGLFGEGVHLSTISHGASALLMDTREVIGKIPSLFA